MRSHNEKVQSNYDYDLATRTVGSDEARLSQPLDAAICWGLGGDFI